MSCQKGDMMAQKFRVRGESDLKPGFHGHHRVHCAICKCASYCACHHLLGRKTLMAGISNPGHPKCPDPPPSWIPVNESSRTSVRQSCHRRALIQWLLGTSKFPTCRQSHAAFEICGEISVAAPRGLHSSLACLSRHAHATGSPSQPWPPLPMSVRVRSRETSSLSLILSTACPCCHGTWTSSRKHNDRCTTSYSLRPKLYDRNTHTKKSVRNLQKCPTRT